MKDSRIDREVYRTTDRYDDYESRRRSPKPPSYERRDKYKVPVHKAVTTSDDDWHDDDYDDDQ